jgi:hypothetical protein
MVQIIDNRADITGTVQSADANSALHVLVEEVEAVDGFPNLSDDAVGQIVTVNVPAGKSPNPAPGARVHMRVRKTGWIGLRWFSGPVFT